MNNNYHFFLHLVPVLRPQLLGLKLMECFSQDKDEMILGFAAARGVKSNYKQFFIRCSVLPSFPCLFLTKDYKRARRNSVNLWEDLYDQELVDVFVYAHERAIGLKLESGLTICFKMFGNRSNILVFENNAVRYSFNQKLKADKGILESDLHRDLSIDWGHLDQKASTLLPTLGKLPIAYLKERNWEKESNTGKKKLLEELLKKLSEPCFYLTKLNQILQLSLVSIGDIEKEFEDPIDAINSYFVYGLKNFSIDREKQLLIRELEKELKSVSTYIEKSEERLKELATSTKNQTLGHILMANLHLVPQRAKEVELNNYETGQPVKIKLKEDLNAQKNAENYYRKAKNEEIERRNIEQNIADRIERLMSLEEAKAQVLELADLKQIRRFKQELFQHRVELPSEQFKSFELDGFMIYVGRNAKNNDELTLKFAKKNDLWLHARDVSGSHVVIKHKAGRNFPNHVIEYAAGLALHFSKRKTESLAPVIYTEKKYVRKIKGSPDGQVVVTKESVLMATPVVLG